MNGQFTSLNLSDQTTACVTGASGMIGIKIVQRLLAAGLKVRVLAHRDKIFDPRVEVVQGDLLDVDSVRLLLEDASFLFHCAAELRDQAKIWMVNVRGTEHLVEQAQGVDLEYFCFLSSAGVIGKTDKLLVDETTPCNPKDEYEKSKLAAENLLAGGMKNCRVVILRPTNVIDDIRPGPFTLALEKNFRNSIKLVLKGLECAHVLHSEDVADAALFFINRKSERGCFFVSRDDDKIKTYADLWRLCTASLRGRRFEEVRVPWSLPISVPFNLRRLLRGPANMGNVCYTSQKLFTTGFNFSMSIREMADRIVFHSRNH